MRAHLSVFMLIARSTIYKILALLLLMAGAEWFLFRFALDAALSGAGAGLGMTPLEQVLANSRAAWAFAVCFVIATALLCLTGCEYGGKPGYTLRRLSVSERSVFAWQCLYNILCFFMLWAFQVLISYALCKRYVAKVDPALTGAQTVFLAFYRSDFLHSLLPLSEMSRWIRNGLLLVCLGLAAAHFPYRQRRRKIGETVIAMAALTLVFFSRALGSFGNDLLVILLSVANMAAVLKNVFWRDAGEEA